MIKPFDSVTKRNFLLLSVSQAILLLVLWTFSPIAALPTPVEIGSAWNRLALHDGLLYELFQSAVTITKAIAFASLIAFGLAFLTTTALFKPVVTWMTGFRFLGFAGITFLFTMWTSNNHELKLWLLTFGMSVFLLTSALQMVNCVSQEEVDYGRTLRMDGWQITWEILVRGRLHETLDIIRQNAAIGWTMLSMVEGLVRSEGGIGSMLIMQSKYLNLGSIFAIQLTILAYGIAQDYGLRFIRNILCPYLKERK